MSLLVAGYINISEADSALIQDYRKKYDLLQYSLINPHFTIVFPVNHIETETFIQEIGKLSKGIEVIHFMLRCAVINKDDFSDYYHIFLVPDDGFSKIVKLHDQLYSGLLEPDLRLDIDYIPHITIGNFKDAMECKRMAAYWNATDFQIPGTITHLDIIEYKDNRIETLKRLELT